MTDFPHPSRPGHYGVAFPDDLKAHLSLLVTALVPGGSGYPSAADAQVVDFIEDRASEHDLARLESLRSDWPADSAEAATRVLEAMESQAPAEFAYLREFVYHAYYASRRVLAAMADRGYSYHGAPQPLGYRIDDEMARPAKARGSYIATEDVKRVSN